MLRSTIFVILTLAASAWEPTSPADESSAWLTVLGDHHRRLAACTDNNICYGLVSGHTGPTSRCLTPPSFASLLPSGGYRLLFVVKMKKKSPIGIAPAQS